MTSEIQEPCDRATCPSCTAHECVSRRAGAGAPTATPAPVLIRDALGIPIRWYELDGKVD